jgi:hypothetical protein
MAWLKAHWKSLVLAGAGAAATYYGGPAAGAAVREYLPKLWSAVVGG